jgi:CRP/FNR family transcriptional regulator, cyclic AMP receptor protein
VSLPPREFLQALSAEEREELLTRGTIRLVDEGQVLIERGEEADLVLVVISGRVRVMHNDTQLAERGPGALLGEMAIVDRRPRSADIVAIEPCKVLTVSANNFRSFIARSPHAALAVIEQLGRRLRESERR